MKLPIGIPPVVGYLHHAYNLTAAQQHPSFEEWLYSYYIQLRYNPPKYWLNFERLGGMWDYCPLLGIQLIYNDFMESSHINVIDLAVNGIKQGYYVWLYIDEFYDPNHPAYHKVHMGHEILLYGYDWLKKCFYSAGFYKLENDSLSQRVNYAFSEIKFKDLLKSFQKNKEKSPVKLLAPNRDITYEFDLQNVKILLQDYLSADNTLVWNRFFSKPSPDYVYGVAVYPWIKSFFDAILNGKITSDPRLVHILLEHKKCMSARVNFMIQTKGMHHLKPVHEACCEIEKRVTILRGLQIKYMATHENNLLERAIASMDEIRDQEIEALTQLLHCIS